MRFPTVKLPDARVSEWTARGTSALGKFWDHQLSGPTDPTRDAGWAASTKPRKGFFTDTSICIGCKACEVACKEWNHVPARPAEDNTPKLKESSYDNSGALGADTWRHVAFIEQDKVRVREARETGAAEAGIAPGSVPDAPLPQVRWLMSSDVCKHCTHAACLDVCPTGSLFRTEFGTVVVQNDVCNGCGYCVAACPFGVIERREAGTVTVGQKRGLPTPQQKVPEEGLAQKCTLCYDRIGADMEPACAHTCPTKSIKYGNHEDMVKLARERLSELHSQGVTEARLYGTNPDDGVGGTGSVFLLLDEPEVYGLPPDPVVTTADLPSMFRLAGVAGTAMIGVALAVFGAMGRAS